MDYGFRNISLEWSISISTGNWKCHWKISILLSYISSIIVSCLNSIPLSYCLILQSWFTSPLILLDYLANISKHNSILNFQTKNLVFSSFFIFYFYSTPSYLSLYKVEYRGEARLDFPTFNRCLFVVCSSIPVTNCWSVLWISSWGSLISARCTKFYFLVQT